MRAWWLVVFAGAVGCKADPVEGANPGDCEDKADNDADGFFDCDDNGCWAAPTCAGSGTHDTDPGVNETDDGGGGSHTDVPQDTDLVVTGDGVNARFKSMSVYYQLDISWDQAGEVICQSYFDVNTPDDPGPDTSCDCTATFRGKGQLQEVEETRNVYWGSWERVSSNCASAPESQGAIVSGMSIDEATVYTNQSGEMFHTWRFDSDGTSAKSWVTHEDEDADTPCMTAGCQSAIELGHFWIVFNRPHPEIDETTLRIYDPVLHQEQTNWFYTEAGPFFIADQGITMNLRHRFATTFSESFTEPEYPTLITE
jgi:hypothetical protein